MKPLFIALLLLLSYSVFAQLQPVTLDDALAIKDVTDPQLSPDGKYAVYTVSFADTTDDEMKSNIWLAATDGSSNLQLTYTGDVSSPRFSPDGKFIAFLSSRENEKDESQVWLMNRAGGEADVLTEVAGGVNDFYWSPDSKKILLLISEMDNDTNPDQPLPLVINRYYFKEDYSGYLKDLYQHLYLFDLSSHDLDTLTRGPYDNYQPCFRPDGQWIAFVSKRQDDPDRNYNEDIFLVEAKQGGELKQLTTSSDPDYEPAFSPDGKQIAYLNGPPNKLFYYGTNNLAVMNADGSNKKFFTEGMDCNLLLPKWSSNGSIIYFMKEEDRREVIMKINADGTQLIRAIDGNREIENYAVGSNNIIFTCSDILTPLELYTSDDNGERNISKQNDQWKTTHRLASYREISFKSKDGTEIHGYVILPYDYMEGNKYPTVLRIHGGPQWQFFNTWRFYWHLYAANGYVIVASNPRGSTGRGTDFCKAIYAKWGTVDIQDVLAGVDFAVKEGIADPNKLAVSGWSYGGILTNYVIASDTRFQCAVSGASISNVLAGYGTDQYIRDYEMELGPPWKNLKTWTDLSYPFLHADRIKTPTLFMCGQNDFNVPLLNSEQMYQALKSLNVETGLVIYPNEFHGIERPSFVIDVLQRHLDWYQQQMK